MIADIFVLSRNDTKKYLGNISTLNDSDLSRILCVVLPFSNVFCVYVNTYFLFLFLFEIIRILTY